ncbi:MAG: DASS family sodium-coupled anion symporter [Pseudomonadota bacterium]
MANLKYINIIKLLLLFLVGTIAWHNSISDELSLQSWHLLVIFICTMLGIVLNPLPISAVALLGAGACLALGVLSTKQILRGFSENVVWLLVFAFFIARGIIKTGLGKRIAYYFISKLGKTTLGLSYGLVSAEFLLSPLIPSVTARGGGIIYPIVESLVNTYGENLTPNEKKRNMGFLSQVCLQANVITSAMFLTAMAANPLIQSLASKEGVEITWGSWALGAIVPGIIALLVMPILVYLMHPPAIKHSPDAPKHAVEALKHMGRLTIQEIIMMIVFVSLITGWILDKKIGLDATGVSMLGVVALLTTGVLTWQDAVNEKNAWDSFVWFAIMVMLSGYLAEFGTIKWIGMKIGQSLSGYQAIFAVPILIGIYFYLHYLFASVTAHVTVLFTTFLLLLFSFNVPPMLAAMLLAYFSTLCGGLTHYGIASAPVYFETKSVSIREWWTIGFALSLVNILIWAGIGGIWWKYLGWY